MNLNALKRSVELTKAKREIFRTPSLKRLRDAVRTAGRTAHDDKQILRLQKQLDSEISAHKAAIEELAAMKAQLDDALLSIKADTDFLAKDRKAQRKRRGKAARQAGRDTKDSGLWDRYDTFRAMRERIKRGDKQLAAATDVIGASKGKITIEPETLVRYYRAWIKKRKTD